MQLNFRSIVALATIAAALGNARPVSAGDVIERFTVDVAPTYMVTGSGDATAPPPPRRIGIGYTKDHPSVDAIVLDYGLSYRLDSATQLYYAHTVFDTATGRILTIPPRVSFVSGNVSDRVDTIGILRTNRSGLNVRAFYFNHVRMGLTGYCVNQQYCTSPAGEKYFNPQTVDEHGYDVGLSYGVGPRTVLGRMLTFAGDVKYVPRSADGPRNPDGSPAYSLNGLGAYPGSKFLFPYSVQLKLPFSKTRTFVPIIGYARNASLYRAESSQQLKTVITYGLAKVLSRDLVLSVIDYGEFGCRCTSSVPTPDNIRYNVVAVKLDYHFTPRLK